MPGFIIWDVWIKQKQHNFFYENETIIEQVKIITHLLRNKKQKKLITDYQGQKKVGSSYENEKNQINVWNLRSGAQARKDQNPTPRQFSYSMDLRRGSTECWMTKHRSCTLFFHETSKVNTGPVTLEGGVYIPKGRMICKYA